MAKWYCLIDGQQSGPIDPAELIHLATTGHLKPTDKVRREDLAEWYEARQVKGLFAAARSQIDSSCMVETPIAPTAPDGCASKMEQATLATTSSVQSDGWDIKQNPGDANKEVLLQEYSVLYKRGFLPNPPIGNIKFKVFSDRFELEPNRRFDGEVIPHHKVSRFDVQETKRLLLPAQRDKIQISYITDGGEEVVLVLEMVSGLFDRAEKRCQRLLECMRNYHIFERFQSKPKIVFHGPCPHCGIPIFPRESAFGANGECPYCKRDLGVRPLRPNGHICPKCSAGEIKTFEYVHALGKTKRSMSVAAGGLTSVASGIAGAAGRMGTVTGLAELCAPPELAKWALSAERQEFNEKIYPKRLAVWKRSWICMTCGSHWVAPE